jgi:hypothetical protein
MLTKKVSFATNRLMMKMHLRRKTMYIKKGKDENPSTRNTRQIKV